MVAAPTHVVQIPRHVLDENALTKNSLFINAYALDYIERSLIPHLEYNILDPFGNNLKAQGLRRARKKFGVVEIDDLEILDADLSTAQQNPVFIRKFGDNWLAPIAYRVYDYSYEQTLDNFVELLNTVTETRDHRKGVRSVVGKGELDGRYVWAEYALSELRSMRDATGTPRNETALYIVDPNSDPQLGLNHRTATLDDTIEVLGVVLDPRYNRTVTPRNADTYVNATALRSRGMSLRNSLQRWLNAYYGHKRLGYDTFEDGNTFRFTFSRQPSVSRADVYNALQQMETQSVAASTGDLEIVNRLAFGGEYVTRRGAGIRVFTDVVDTDPYPLGHLRVVVGKDEVLRERSYPVLKVGKRVYVRASDVSQLIPELEKAVTKMEDRPTYRFFPRTPPEITPQPS